MQLAMLANYRVRTSRPSAKTQQLPMTPPHAVAPVVEVEVAALHEAEEARDPVARPIRQRITDSRTEGLILPLQVPRVNTAKTLDQTRVLLFHTAAFRQRILVRGSSFLVRWFIMILLILQTA